MGALGSLPKVSLYVPVHAACDPGWLGVHHGVRTLLGESISLSWEKVINKHKMEGRKEPETVPGSPSLPPPRRPNGP